MHQQESGTSAPAHEPTQEPTWNNHLSTIKEEAQTQRLMHVKKNVMQPKLSWNRWSCPDAFDTMRKLPGASETKGLAWTTK